MQHWYLNSPIGQLLISGNERAIQSISFPQGSRARRAPEAGSVESHGGALGAAAQQLREYFEGRRTEIELPLEPRGTAFQQSVWKRLLEIPYGQTISYGELARQVGNPKAARAVGAANGANPLPIVVPCHRVIGSGGSLTGFGGGLPVKEGLLELEARVTGVSRRSDRRPGREQLAFFP
jgi:methylated-DNA-[protein]-cysteine S-methyltransferase